MAQRKLTPSLRIPESDRMVDDSGILSVAWRDFYRLIKSTLDPLGVEKTFPLENNTIVATDITGLKVSSANISQAIVEYLIQRVTTGTNPVELIETGSFTLAYKPTSQSWVMSTGPSTAGVTLTVTAGGQVQYVTTLVDGTASISKISYRIRTLAAKNTQYSNA